MTHAKHLVQCLEHGVRLLVNAGYHTPVGLVAYKMCACLQKLASQILTKWPAPGGQTWRVPLGGQKRKKWLKGTAPVSAKWPSRVWRHMVTLSSPLYLQKIPKQAQDSRPGTQQATLCSLITQNLEVRRNTDRCTLLASTFEPGGPLASTGSS